MPLRAIKGIILDENELLSMMSYSNLSGRLFGSTIQYMTGLFKYEPLWLGDEVLKDGDKPMCKASGPTGGRLRVILARFCKERDDELFEACNRTLGSRYGWMFEFYARIWGVDLVRSAFRRLWVCLADEKRRDRLAKIVYLMAEPRFCQFKKLLFNLPQSRYWDFVDILDLASDQQFDHYIRILSTTHWPVPTDRVDSRNPGVSGRPPTNQESMPPEGKENETEWLGLQHRIKALPNELRDMIASSLWNIAFQPGKIFPKRQPRYNGRFYSLGKFYDPPIPRLFLALNKDLYPQMRTRYWSGNTWVIGYGHAEDTMGFLDHVPDPESTGLDIKLHLELRLSRDDLPGSSELCPNISNKDIMLRAQQDGNRKPDMLDILVVYEERLRTLIFDLLWLYGCKMRLITKLKNLEELTLDFNEAFIPGYELFNQRWLPGPRFQHGNPSVFRIVAPSKALEEKLHSMYRK